MKAKRFILKVTAMILISFALVTSCRKDNQAPGYSYFVSKELAVSYNQGYINALIDIVSISVPDVGSFKPLVVSDVNIYSLIYKTTVNGKQVNASGLVCVPSTPGSYPVLKGSACGAGPSAALLKKETVPGG